jgi:glycosyltransferase involved in cell wall biosynthesis
MTVEKKMRIVFVVPGANLSGGIRVVAIYADRLLARGHEVTVVASQPRKIKPKAIFKRLLKGRPLWRPRREGPTHFDHMRAPFHVGATPRKVTAADVPDADVVVATWWQTAYDVAELPPSKGAKAYFIQHHEIHKRQPEYLVRESYRLPLKKITISQWLVDLMRDEYEDDDVDLVHNSVDTTTFHSPERSRGMPPTVGFIYDLRPRKGVEVCVEAIERARLRFPDLKVVAFGKKPIRADKPLPGNVDYVQGPSQEEIRKVYARCDVWLCGSSGEGFHLPPLEAMACRCPVVSTRVGGAIDVIEEGANGHLVDVGDAHGLGDRLGDVLALDPEAWRKMSDAALSRALRYSWDDATLRFEACLARAAAQRSATYA